MNSTGGMPSPPYLHCELDARNRHANRDRDALTASKRIQKTTRCTFGIDDRTKTPNALGRRTVGSSANHVGPRPSRASTFRGRITVAFPIASTTLIRIDDRGTTNSTPLRRNKAAVFRASRNVRQRFATMRGATRPPPPESTNRATRRPRRCPRPYPGAEGHDDRIRCASSCSCTPASRAMTGDRTGIRATAAISAAWLRRDDGRRAKPAHCPRQGQPAGCTNDEISGRMNRARNVLLAFGLRLREDRDCCAAASDFARRAVARQCSIPHLQR